MTENNPKSNLRQRVDKIKFLRCKNLIVVIEEPNDLANIGSVIRNVNALGAEKVYIIDSKKVLPDDWTSMPASEFCHAHLHRQSNGLSLRDLTTQLVALIICIKKNLPLLQHHRMSKEK